MRDDDIVSPFLHGKDDPSSRGLPSDPDPENLEMGATSDSTIVIPPVDVPSKGPTPGSFDQEFRRQIADTIHDVLSKAYGAQSGRVRHEASKRNLSVEQLLAAYLARLIMDKIDSEYI